MSTTARIRLGGRAPSYMIVVTPVHQWPVQYDQGAHDPARVRDAKQRRRRRVSQRSAAYHHIHRVAADGVHHALGTTWAGRIDDEERIRYPLLRWWGGRSKSTSGIAHQCSQSRCDRHIVTALPARDVDHGFGCWEHRLAPLRR